MNPMTAKQRLIYWIDRLLDRECWYWYDYGDALKGPDSHSAAKLFASTHPKPRIVYRPGQARKFKVHETIEPQP